MLLTSFLLTGSKYQVDNDSFILRTLDLGKACGKHLELLVVENHKLWTMYPYVSNNNLSDLAHIEDAYIDAT